MLKLINPKTYPPERVERLWDKLKDEDYAFDDTMRGNHEVLLASLFMPGTECYEIGDLDGFVIVTGITPRVQATIHFAHWGTLTVAHIRKLGLQLMSDMFDRYRLERLNAYVPHHNDKVRRLATLLGYKLEGTLRRAFLYKGEYLDLYAYGILREEFDRYKELTYASRSSNTSVSRGNGSSRRRVSTRS